MKTNLEKQGIRAWHIVGGIFTLILATFLILLYLPAFLNLFNIAPMWDMEATFTDMFGSHIMEFIKDFGALIVLGLVFLLSIVSIAVRPSMSATNFRLTKTFATLGLALPQLAEIIKNNFSLDITSYVGYGVIGFFVLAFLFYLIGMINRAIKKYNPNKATTYLVFSATIWFILIMLTALYSANEMFGLNNALLNNVETILSGHLLAVLGIFFAICAIWMLITIPNRVRVEYDTSNKYSPKTKDGQARPVVMTAGESQDDAQRAPVQSNPNARFDHQYTTQPQQGLAQNPVLNTGNNVATQPVNAYPNRPVQPRPVVQPANPAQPQFPQSQAYNQPYGAPRPAVQPAQQPMSQPNAPRTNMPQNPFVSRQPQTTQPNTPFATRQQPNTTQQPFGQQPRPAQVPQPYSTPRQTPQPQQPFGQQPRPAPTQPYSTPNRPTVQPTQSFGQQSRPAQAPQPYSAPRQAPQPQQPFGQQPRPAPAQPYGTPPRPTQPPVNPNGTNGTNTNN